MGFLCSLLLHLQVAQGVPPKHRLSTTHNKPNPAKKPDGPSQRSRAPKLPPEPSPLEAAGPKETTLPETAEPPQEPSPAATTERPPCEQDPTALLLRHYALHETYCFQPTSNGLSAEQQSALTHLLRCHHTQKEREMDAKVIQLLADIVHKIHPSDKPTRVTIIAGYRAPKQAEAMGNGKSDHTQGKALDFFIGEEGITAERLFDEIRTQFHGVRLIYYPNHNPSFVHIAFTDNGKDWVKIDDAPPGQASVYRDPPPATPKNG